MTKNKLLLGMLLFANSVLISAEGASQQDNSWDAFFAGNKFTQQIGFGIGQGIGRGIGDPVSLLLKKFVLSITKPMATLKFAERSAFLSLNDNVLDFETLAQWYLTLNSLININMIDPASNSSKALRRAILTDMDGDQVQAVTDDYKFGINLVTAQLQEVKNELEVAIASYQKLNANKSRSMPGFVKLLSFPVVNTVLPYAGNKLGEKYDYKRTGLLLGVASGVAASSVLAKKALNPYNRNECNKLIFLSKQLIKQIDKFVEVSNSIENLAHLTDKKDEIQRALKSISAQIKDLAIIVDPDTTFDGQRAGLKLVIENGNTTRAAAPGANLNLSALAGL